MLMMLACAKTAYAGEIVNMNGSRRLVDEEE